MLTEQFSDKGLAQFAYAVLSDETAEIVVIDPARDPALYLDFARQHGATIVAIIETHPHADFVSSHLELAHATGATIRVSRLVGAEYPHEPFDDGDQFTLGELTFRALNTPGHSPDSISVVVSRNGRDEAVFTGDTLFVGDVGRPDLRESVGNLTANRETLARQMYASTRDKLMPLADDVIVYPAHGAGSLCGKALGTAGQSTIGAERATNPALRPLSVDAFVAELLRDQPFVPRYFAHDVALNRTGAPTLDESLRRVPRLAADTPLGPGVLVVDTRPEAEFKRGHLPGAINLQTGGKFETWLGSVVSPDEPFYLLAADDAALEASIRKLAKIGYEAQIVGARVGSPSEEGVLPKMDLARFREHPAAYTVVDVRNRTEVEHAPIFADAINLPLPELRERTDEIPTDKPIVVHCAGGYRSAAGSSLIAAALPDATVYDLGEAVTTFPTH